MVIDKYDMVLYDFCTNDEIIELVEQINESEKPSDAVKYQIRRSLAISATGMSEWRGLP